MSRIAWDELAERRYEFGVDRGVLYNPGGTGVPWNGLVEVEAASTKEVEPIHYDGVKVNDLVIPGDFEGKITAFTYPDELVQFLGFVEEEPGFFFSEQPQRKFHLCWRTKMNTATEDESYKIHLLYNVIAVTDDVTYETISDELEPMEFEWNITATPEEIDGLRPTAYIVLDSRKIDPLLLADVEDILYGSSTDAPIMPTIKSLMAFVKKWDRITILDNGDGTWTAIDRNGDYITDNGDGTLQITEADATYLDANTYEIRSTDKNVEDLWPT